MRFEGDMMMVWFQAGFECLDELHMMYMACLKSCWEV